MNWRSLKRRLKKLNRRPPEKCRKISNLFLSCGELRINIETEHILRIFQGPLIYVVFQKHKKGDCAGDAQNIATFLLNAQIVKI